MNATTARFQALAAAVLFSTGGAGIKAAAFTGPQIASLRAGIAAAALLLWLRGRVAWSRRALAVGAIYAITTTLFVNANKLTTSANAIFLQATAPLHILLLGPLLIGEHFHRRDVIYLMAVGTGLVLAFLGRPPATASAPDPATGNLLALLCSVMWALTLMGLRRLERDPVNRGSGVAAMVAGNLFAFIVPLPFIWPLPQATPADWGTIVFLGVFQIGLSYVCLTAAMRRLPALEVSLLLLLEPVLNPVWAWIVHGEHPGKWVLTGGTIIVAATAIKTCLDASRSIATSDTKGAARGLKRPRYEGEPR